MNGRHETVMLLAVYRSLNPAEQQAIHSHVASCRACALRRAAYTEVDRQLASLSAPELPASLSKPLAAVLAARAAPRGGAAVASRVGNPSEFRARSSRTRRQPGCAAAREQRSPVVFRRALLPIGVFVLLTLGVWLVIRAVRPTQIQLAETPSVTPTATPLALATAPGLALASPQRDIVLTAYWAADGEPAPRPLSRVHLVASSAPAIAVALTPAVLRQPGLLGSGLHAPPR
ncbi:MAG: hypothetical protein FJ011_20100 [Chloroflexi bacterium]|nr:hypothetical protein [Chloroflexota bacterium]